MHQLPELLHDLHTAHLIVFHIHVGTNDLVQLNFFAIRQTLASLLMECKDMFLHTRLVWTCILPHLFYYGARSQQSMKHD